MTRILQAIIILVSFLTVSFTAHSQTKSTHIALVTVKNLDSSPQFDYLGGMIQGILLYDFTRASGVTVVERSQIEAVMNEQQLQSSGIVNDPSSASKIGKLLGVSFLVFGEYVVMGQEALITVRIISVQSGKVSVFTERGRTENIIHLLAEKSCEFLTGKKESFRGTAGDRSLVTLRDEAPGSIALYSPIIRAEIFLDNEFVGYTKGNAELPFDMANIKPGPHTVRVHLGNAWGVIELPQVKFRDWEETVTVQPGKRHALRDRTRDFNGQIYDLMSLNRTDIYINEKTANDLKKPVTVSFVDREGKKVTAVITITPDLEKSQYTVTINYNGKTTTHTAVAEPKKDNRFEYTAGKIKCDIRIDTRRNPLPFVMYIDRTDLWQGMHEDEAKK